MPGGWHCVCVVSAVVTLVAARSTGIAPGTRKAIPYRLSNKTIRALQRAGPQRRVSVGVGFSSRIRRSGTRLCHAAGSHSLTNQPRRHACFCESRISSLAARSVGRATVDRIGKIVGIPIVVADAQRPLGQRITCNEGGLHIGILTDAHCAACSIPGIAIGAGVSRLIVPERKTLLSRLEDSSLAIAPAFYGTVLLQ